MFPKLNTGPEVIKLFLCSTQLSTKFILLINVKMPTIVGIIAFISLINTTSERFTARNFFLCWYFSLNDKLEFCAQLSGALKKFHNFEAWSMVAVFSINCEVENKQSNISTFYLNKQS